MLPKAGVRFYLQFLHPGLREALTFLFRPGRKAGPCDFRPELEWRRIQVGVVRPALVGRNKVSAMFDGLPPT